MPLTGPIRHPVTGVAPGTTAFEQRTRFFPDNPESQLPKANWCWAAVCQAVHWGYRQDHVSQRDIVERCDPQNADADETFQVGFALESRLDFTIRRLDSENLSTLVPQNCVSFPVPAIISWDNGAQQTHAICAIGTGHIGNEPAILIYDPLPASKSDTGADLIKLVAISVLESGYLEQSRAQARGHWTRAMAVTGNAA